VAAGKKKINWARRSEMEFSVPKKSDTRADLNVFERANDNR